MLCNRFYVYNVSNIKHEDSLIIRKVHKAEKTLPQTGADDTRIPSVIGAISSLIAGLGLVGVSHKKRRKNDQYE